MKHYSFFNKAVVVFFFLFVAITAKSQTYYYKLSKTEGLGVYNDDYLMNKLSMAHEIIVITIYKDYMQWYSVSMSSFATYYADDPNQWMDSNVNKIKKFIKNTSMPPSSNTICLPTYGGIPWEAVKIVTKEAVYKFNSKRSSSSLNTYSYWYTVARTESNYASRGPRYWDKFQFGKINFSFSTDMNQMIIWSGTNTDDLLRYSRFSPEDLQPDLNRLLR